MAAVFRAAGFPVGSGDRDLKVADFPQAISELELDDLIGLVIASGKLGLAQPTLKFQATDLSAAIATCGSAAKALRDWPQGFHNFLSRCLTKDFHNPGALSLQRVFGSFYQYYLRIYEHEQFGFLRGAFEQFIVNHWPGVVRGQHRAFSAEIRRRFRWIPALQAATAAGVSSSYLGTLVGSGDLKGLLVRPAKSKSRTECWIDRDSLSCWLANRDAELAAYISRHEVKQILGLTSATLMSLVRAGIIRSVNGRERGFPPGICFRREDVEAIDASFRVHVIDTPVEPLTIRVVRQISLREALRTQLGRRGFPATIRAVLQGELTPTGRRTTIPGIMGYLFRLEDLRKYHPRRARTPAPPGFMTHAEAAAALGLNTEIIRNVVVQGIMRSPARQRGCVKLVRSEDVQRFAAQYITISSLAARFNTRSEWVARYLRGQGIAILVIHMPGKGKKLFVDRRFVAGVCIPAARRAKAVAAVSPASKLDICRE